MSLDDIDFEDLTQAIASGILKANDVETGFDAVYDKDVRAFLAALIAGSEDRRPYDELTGGTRAELYVSWARGYANALVARRNEDLKLANERAALVREWTRKVIGAQTLDELRTLRAEIKAAELGNDQTIREQFAMRWTELKRAAEEEVSS